MRLTKEQAKAILRKLRRMEDETREELNRTRAKAVIPIEISFNSKGSGASTTGATIDYPSVFENDRSRANLILIALATKRIRTEIYTRCIGCDGEVGKLRQKNNPLALLCLGCQMELESAADQPLVGMELVRAIEALLAA